MSSANDTSMPVSVPELLADAEPPATVEAALAFAVQPAASMCLQVYDLEYLLAHSIGKTRAFLRAYPERMLTSTEQKKFSEALQRRLAGEPVAYITGQRSFWKQTLHVDERVLIPRPETEGLVECALACDLPEAARVLDLGTGSGAIAIALAAERPHWQLHAVDISRPALALAEQNARGYGLDNIKFIESDWFANLNSRYDLIVSNPPYIAAQDPHLFAGDLRAEPQRALSAGQDGLQCIRAIVTTAPKFLSSGAVLALEHGADQAAVVCELFQAQGFATPSTLYDLAGLPRHCMARVAAHG